MVAGVVTTSEAAIQLGVTSGRVRQLVIDGTLPSQKIGHLTVIATKDLAEYKKLQKNKVKRK